MISTDSLSQCWVLFRRYRLTDKPKVSRESEKAQVRGREKAKVRSRGKSNEFARTTEAAELCASVRRLCLATLQVIIFSLVWKTWWCYRRCLRDCRERVLNVLEEFEMHAVNMLRKS